MNLVPEQSSRTHLARFPAEDIDFCVSESRPQFWHLFLAHTEEIKELTPRIKQTTKIKVQG